MYACSAFYFGTIKIKLVKFCRPKTLGRKEDVPILCGYRGTMLDYLSFERVLIKLVAIFDLYSCTVS